MRFFQPPQTFSACNAVTRGDAQDSRLLDPKKIITKMHVDWVHAPAQQFKRISVDSNGDAVYLLNYVGEALEQCEVCGASDKAPHAPIAGTSAVSMFNEKSRAGLRFPVDPPGTLS